MLQNTLKDQPWCRKGGVRILRVLYTVPSVAELFVTFICVSNLNYCRTLFDDALQSVFQTIFYIKKILNYIIFLDIFIILILKIKHVYYYYKFSINKTSLNIS